MNWYVLFVLANKTEQLVKNLNNQDKIKAFVPKYEYYRRIAKDYDIKPMFTNYIFVKSVINQTEFNTLLLKMNNEKKGLIKQLVHHDASALRNDEIEMFNYLLDESYVVKMSQAFLQDGKAKVYQGPLVYFEKNIIKIDKYNQVAYLNLSFMDQRIKAGLKLTSKN